LLAFVN